MPETASVKVRTARPDDGEQITAIWRAACDEGALASFEAGEIARLVEGIAVEPESVLVAANDGSILGFLHLEAHVIAVRPDVRRRGIGSGLVRAAEQTLTAKGQRLLLWLPDENPGAAAFCAAIGYRHHSSLWQMRLATIADVTSPEMPAGFELVSVDRVRVEEYVALFNEAFASHPTPLSVTPKLVRWVHERPEFDPSSIGVLRTRDGHELVGFCRIRLHGKDEPGEIALIGVRPGWRGRGLGRWLLQWGLAQLSAGGYPGAGLSVESENDDALALYERAGFARTFEWRRFARIEPIEPTRKANPSA